MRRAILFTAMLVALVPGVAASSSKRCTAILQAKHMKDAVLLFQIATKRLPTDAEGLEILAVPTPPTNKPYIGIVPHDPWDHPFRYRQDSKSTHGFIIASAGADGVFDTADDLAAESVCSRGCFE